MICYLKSFFRFSSLSHFVRTFFLTLFVFLCVVAVVVLFSHFHFWHFFLRFLQVGSLTLSVFFSVVSYFLLTFVRYFSVYFFLSFIVHSVCVFVSSCIVPVRCFLFSCVSECICVRGSRLLFTRLDFASAWIKSHKFFIWKSECDIRCSHDRVLMWYFPGGKKEEVANNTIWWTNMKWSELPAFFCYQKNWPDFD